MPRSKSRSRSSKSKAAASSAAPYDLSDPNINGALSLAVAVGAGVALNGGGVPSSVPGALSFFTNTSNVASVWPYNWLLTLHVLNSVKSNGKWWANDLVSCCFSAFGGYMFKDVLDGNLQMPTLFGNGEANLSLVIVCWFLVNHNIPFTGINAYKTVTDKVNEFLPLNTVMDLCSLAFNTTLLCGVASSVGVTESSWQLMPLALGKMMFLCVAVACSSEFFGTDGLAFDVGSSCSAAVERAAVVGFWYGTNGLETLPFVGSAVAPLGAQAEAFLGGRAAAIFAVLALIKLFGHLIPVNPLEKVYDVAHQVSGVNRG